VRALVVADTHIYEFKQFAHAVEYGINSRLKEELEVLELLIDRANEDDIDVFIHAGDLWHEKHRASVRTVYETLRILRKLKKPSFWASGNHDLLFKHPYFPYSALNMVEFALGSRCMIDAVSDVFEGLSIVCVPYCYNVSDQLHMFDAVRDKSRTVLITHGDVVGQHYGSYEVREGLPPELLDEFAFAVVGHYHNPTIVSDTVLIPGAPQQHNWGDRGQERGCWIVELDPSACSIESFEEIDSSRFVEVNLDENPDYRFNERDFYRVTTTRSVSLPKGVKAIVVSPEVVEVERRAEISLLDDPATLVERYAEARGGDKARELALLGKGFISRRER